MSLLSRHNLNYRIFVAVNVAADYVGCALFSMHKTRPLLQAYKCVPLHGRGVFLFNPTRISTIVSSFCAQHNIQNAFIGFALDGACVTEKIMIMQSASPKAADFTAQQPELKRLMWNSSYLYAHAEQQFAFYVAGASRELVAQYRLMAYAHSLNVVTITTELAALLHVHTHAHHASRQQELASLISAKPAFSALLTRHMCARFFDVALGVSVSEDAAPFLMKSYGLLCSEEV